MIASHLYHQKPTKEKEPPTLHKYVTQRSLAVLMFIALAVVASVRNKPPDKRKSGLSTSVSISHFTANLHRLKVAIKSIEQTFVELLALYPIYMRSLPHSSYLKAALLFIQLIMCFGSPTVAQAGDKVSSFCRPVGPELDYQSHSRQNCPASEGSNVMRKRTRA